MHVLCTASTHWMMQSQHNCWDIAIAQRHSKVVLMSSSSDLLFDYIMIESLQLTFACKYLMLHIQENAEIQNKENQ